MSVADFRRECRAYAAKYVDIMREDFKRLGVFGTWDEPYLTMKPGYQAAIVRALGTVRRAGHGLQGQEAGALVHALPHRAGRSRGGVRAAHLAVDLRRVPAAPSRAADELGAVVCPRWRAGRVSVAHLDDDAVDDPVESGGRVSSGLRVRRVSGAARRRRGGDETVVIVAKDLAEAVAAKTGRAFGEPLATFEGRVMERLVFRHPLYERDSLGVLGDYVTLEAGTGVVHTAPGHGADDYHTGVKYGLEIYGPLDPGGHFLETVELFGGLQVLEANPKIEAALAEARPALASRGLRPLVSALLALPQPGDLPGDVAVVHRDGRAEPARARARGDRRRRAGSRRGAASASTT